MQARISSCTKNCGNREKSEENFDGPYLMAHALRALDAANRNRTTPLGDDTRAHYERPDTDAVHEVPSTGPLLSPTSLQGRCRCRVDRHAENLAVSGQGRARPTGRRENFTPFIKPRDTTKLTECPSRWLG